MLPRQLKKYHRVIEDYENGPDGVWVYLKPGWISDNNTHQLVGDTINEVATGLCDIKPCHCADCMAR